MGLFHPTPRGFEHEDDSPETGITLLEYYAAHAPKAPEWFKPVMEPRPKKPQHWEYRDGVTEADIKFIKRNYFEDDWIGKERPTKRRRQIMKQYDDEMEKWYKADKAWEAENKLQHIVQWRFKYAQAMVDQTHSSY